MVPDDRDIVIKILSEIHILAEFLEGLDFDAFLEDKRASRAVCMTMVYIGELAGELSEEFQNENSDATWKVLSGLCEMIVRKSQSIHMKDVWASAKIDMPEFGRRISALIDENSGGNRDNEG